MLDVTGFAALIKRKRGEARLTQETLALDVFGDPARKADISRLENARVPNPQEATVQKICQALNISAAEMEPLRQSRPSAAQLDNIPSLSREALQNLAARFNIEESFDLSDRELRRLLTLKAEEHRKLVIEVESLNGLSKRIESVHSAALHAVKNGNYAKANQFLQNAQEIHNAEILRPALETNARLLETQAEIALIGGDVSQAVALLAAAADGFAHVDRIEPTRRRIMKYVTVIRNYGLRHGGAALPTAEEFLRPFLDDQLKLTEPTLWAAGQNWLAIVISDRGERIEGPDGTDLIAKAIDIYKLILGVYTRAAHPMSWAMVQNNLGTALQEKGLRVEEPLGASLLRNAATAYQDSLQIRTRAQHPKEWAMTQNNLGIVLQNQGLRTKGINGSKLFEQSVAAYYAALEVINIDEHQTDWAMIQNSLGSTLRNHGSRTHGATGANLLAQALVAYEFALNVRTQSDHPLDWAETTANIALTFQAMAQHDSCLDPLSQLTHALAAVDRALPVFDPIHLSHHHTQASALRDRIQAKLDALPRA